MYTVYYYKIFIVGKLIDFTCSCVVFVNKCQFL